MATIRLRPELMTAAAFEPYGEVWDTADRPADHRTMTPVSFDYDGRVTATMIWQPKAGLGFTMLERHFGVTQAFVHMGGAPATVCVASATGSDDPNDVPAPDSVRAFRIEPGQGFAYRRGTWHSLDRFLLDGPGANFLILNADPNPTQMVNYATGALEIYENLGKTEPARAQLDTAPGVDFEIAP